jgi:hypothetical protein
VAAGTYFGNMFGVPQQPNLLAPTAFSQTPTIQQTNTTALQNALSVEQNEKSASTILTGGGGLMDKPQTTSSVLLGS